ncbi:hypothetical protein ILW06_003768 [Salmonella enterica]|nr:hypothetical protein [Salmonella enterica]
MKMPAFEWVHVQLHQQKGMISLSPPTICNSAETAMYRVKQLFGGSLTLRDYDGQVAEAMALVRALNKMTKAGMPESVRIA